MPKSYSEQEREYIVQRLKQEGAKCLAQYGIRHTTVDEIVKRVKIPKGTFYLFYKSKELLLFEIILEYHDKIEKSLYDAVCAVNPEDMTADKLTDILCGFYNEAADSALLKMMNADEIELLARKLPPEVLEAHLNEDNSMVERVFAVFKPNGNADAATLSAAFRAVYFATLHKDEIGEECFPSALRLIISGLVKQLLTGE